MATKRRVIVKVDAPTTVNDPNAPKTMTPVTTTQYRVDWTMAATDLSGVRAFNVVLTISGGNPRNTGDVIKSRTVWDPAARSYTFADLQSGNYTAWVQTVVDGADSDWVASTGIVVSDDLVPTFRSSDDRNSAALVEDFRSASLPAGFTVGNASTYDLTTTPGELAMVQGGSGFALYLLWYPNTWATAQNPPVDNIRDSASIGNAGARLMLKIKVDNTAAYSANNPLSIYFYGGVAGFGVETINIPLVNDGKYHIYYVPVGRIQFNNSPYVQANIPVSFGSTVRFDAVAIAWGNFDSSLDGNVDHGITARNQFGKVVGGDYFLQSSIRQATDPSGSQLIIEPNGVFFRNADGSLNETAYKQGRRCNIGVIQNVGTNAWGSNSIGGMGIIPGAQIYPALPAPTAVNKIRMIMEPNGAVVNDTGTQPQRIYIEPFNVGVDAWTFSAAMFFGGSLGMYSVFGPWSQSNEAKSSLLLNASHGGTGVVDATNDAWYYGANDMPSQVNSTYYYRMVVWLKATMPSYTKTNGRPYFVDFTFYFSYGYATQNTSDISMNSFFETRAHRMRGYTDGRTYLFPMWWTGMAYNVTVSGSFAPLSRYDVQNVKVDWTGATAESGAPSGAVPSSCAIDHIDFHYITGATAQLLTGLSYNLTFLEEY